MKKFILIILAGLLLLTMTCSKEHDQPTVPDPDTLTQPPIPTITAVQTGDRTVTLTWMIEGTAREFKVYRRHPDSTRYVLRTTTELMTYTETGLINGRLYEYAVSALNADGIEGLKSESVIVTPNVYAFTINQGDLYTNSAAVTLQFSTNFPEDTGWVMLSNSPEFDGAIWQPYQLTMTWQLSPGDGLKVVYARFRDPQDNESDTVQDSIVLDTQASINNLTTTTDSQPLNAGDTVHFTLDTGEIDGQASVTIGEPAVLTLMLYDDGTHGDPTADDGRYERDYIVTENLEIESAAVIGYFTDVAGNEADPLTAQNTITILQPPQPVVLNNPVPIGTSFTSLRLTWSVNTNDDFSVYRLYRRLANATAGLTIVPDRKKDRRQIAAPMDGEDDSTFTLITVIAEQTLTTYDDTGLVPETDYEYRVDVVDQSGLVAESNVVVGQTNANGPPLAVTITSVSAVTGTDDQLRVAWIPNTEADFFAYQLYRATSETFADSVLIEVINDQATNQFVDGGLLPETAYFYRIYCVDDASQRSASNIADGMTNPNLAPTPVSILAVNAVDDTDDQLEVIWTENPNEDFLRYELYRDPEDGVDQNSTLVTYINDPAITFFTNENLDAETRYYYRVYVRDTGDATSASNILSGVTGATPFPTPVELLQVVPVANTFDQLRLTWTANTETDFASYLIYRDTNSSFNNPLFITSLNDPQTVTFTDTDLDPATMYYYQIRVLNQAQLTSNSNILGGSTNADLPPAPVVIYDVSPVTGTDDQIQVSWTQNADSDFLAYQLFRATSQDFNNPVSVTTNEDVEATSFVDSGLASGTTYFYRVRVFDGNNHTSDSNIASGATYANLPPTAVNILSIEPPDNINFTSLTVTWTVNNDDDFDRYEIYRATTSDFNNPTYVTGIGANGTTTYTNGSLEPNTTYFYRVDVVDTQEATSSSPIESGTTNADLPPTPVNLISVTTPTGTSDQLRLSWLANTDADFAAYEIRRSPNQDMSDMVTIEVVNDQQTTQYLDTGLMQNTTYYYRVDAYDAADQFTAGNVASGSTGVNVPPTPVALAQAFNITANGATFNWTVNNDADFDYYALYRDTVPNVTDQSYEVALFTDRLETSYRDETLDENTTYYFRVFVVDQQGASSGSNTVSLTTLDGFPTAVTLLSVTPPSNTDDQLQIFWLTNTDSDFEAYHLLRATNLSMTQNLTTVTVISDQQTNAFLDTALSPSTTYYYRIDVYDESGHSTPGNVLSGTTGGNIPPSAVVLSEPFDILPTSVTLNWSVNNDPDFARYTLYRALTPNVTEQSQQVTVITESLETTFVDENLNQNTTYYYRVFVADQLGATAGSNTVSATTVDGPPTAVVLDDPTSISENGMTLTWSQNTDPDFGSYRLYRSTVAGTDQNDVLVTTITDVAQTFFDDSGLVDNTTYFYRVYVYDQSNAWTRSNEVSATTENGVPPAVNLTTVQAVANNAIELEWSQSNAHDFSAYRVYRDEQPGVTLQSELVITLNDVALTTFTDTGLDENTTYYYRIFVEDEGGLLTGSNIDNATTFNALPLAVTLNANEVNGFANLNWTPNTQADFATYTVYRSAQPGVTTSSQLLATLTETGSTTYVDTNVQPDQIWYYRVFVTDTEGLQTGSNEVAIYIPPEEE